MFVIDIEMFDQVELVLVCEFFVGQIGNIVLYGVFGGVFVEGEIQVDVVYVFVLECFVCGGGCSGQQCIGVVEMVVVDQVDYLYFLCVLLVVVFVCCVCG